MIFLLYIYLETMRLEYRSSNPPGTSSQMHFDISNFYDVEDRYGKKLNLNYNYLKGKLHTFIVLILMKDERTGFLMYRRNIEVARDFSTSKLPEMDYIGFTNDVNDLIRNRLMNHITQDYSQRTEKDIVPFDDVPFDIHTRITSDTSLEPLLVDKLVLWEGEKTDIPRYIEQQKQVRQQQERQQQEQQQQEQQRKDDAELLLSITSGH